MSSVVHKKSTPPWWIKSLARIIQKRRSLYFKYRATRSKTDYQNYAFQCNLVKVRVCSGQMAYEEQLIKKFKANPRALYAYIQAKQKVKDTISYLVKENGSTIENNEDIATALGQFFQTTCSEETLDYIPELSERATSRLSEITIAEQLVLSKLLRLNSNKTPGSDKIHPCLLKNCAASLCKPICYLFNQSLHTGELPADWKKCKRNSYS